MNNKCGYRLVDILRGADGWRPDRGIAKGVQGKRVKW